jgi:hypothetical protein
MIEKEELDGRMDQSSGLRGRSPDQRKTNITGKQKSKK